VHHINVIHRHVKCASAVQHNQIYEKYQFGNITVHMMERPMC